MCFNLQPLKAFFALRLLKKVQQKNKNFVQKGQISLWPLQKKEFITLEVA